MGGSQSQKTPPPLINKVCPRPLAGLRSGRISAVPTSAQGNYFKSPLTLTLLPPSNAQQALQGGATGGGSKGPGCGLGMHFQTSYATRSESNAQAGEWTDSFVRANHTPQEHERALVLLARWSTRLVPIAFTPFDPKVRDHFAFGIVWGCRPTPCVVYADSSVAMFAATGEPASMSHCVFCFSPLSRVESCVPRDERFFLFCFGKSGTAAGRQPPAAGGQLPTAGD